MVFLPPTRPSEVALADPAFALVPLPVVQMVKFNKRCLNEDETVAHYVAALTNLA